jgi:hypothetical protein
VSPAARCGAILRRNDVEGEYKRKSRVCYIGSLAAREQRVRDQQRDFQSSRSHVCELAQRSVRAQGYRGLGNSRGASRQMLTNCQACSARSMRAPEACRAALVAHARCSTSNTKITTPATSLLRDACAHLIDSRTRVLRSDMGADGDQDQDPKRPRRRRRRWVRSTARRPLAIQAAMPDAPEATPGARWILWLIAIVFVGYAVPAYLAYERGVFSKTQLEQTVLGGEVCSSLCTAFETPTDNCLKYEDSELGRFCLAHGAITPELLDFVPFFPGVSTIARPLVLLLLFVLAFPHSSPRYARSSHANTARQPQAPGSSWLWWAVFFAGALVLTNVARQFAPRTEDGGFVISATSWDIDKVSCIIQHLFFTAVGVLFGKLWANELDAQKPPIFPSAPAERTWRALVSLALDRKALVEQGERLNDWIERSLLLACACAPLAAAYWWLVGKDHDYRYLPTACAFHIIWLATSCLIARPTLDALRHAHEARTAALAALTVERAAENGNGATALPEPKALAEDFDRLRPVPRLYLLLVVVGSLVTLLAPLVQLLKP